MAGVYLHIPFCAQVCHYCDFHKSASLSNMAELVEAMLLELELRAGYLGGRPVKTIYFGGGTPSLLPVADIARLVEQVARHNPLDPGAEITLEANPEDLDPAYLEALARTPVNRLSLGTQSFFDQDLAFMHRRHGARQAVEAVRMARRAGFDNLSIDLIYGLPGMGRQRWTDNLRQALELDAPHVSAYHLTYEEGTPFERWKRSGKITPIDEQESLWQFDTLADTLAAAGYEHYEISNFARPGWHSRHNSSYWLGDPYLGVGPSAHSYDGRDSRQWNVRNNPRYIRALKARQIPAEGERLDPAARLNELVMTRVRTQWGIDLDQVELGFGAQARARLLADAQAHLRRGHLELLPGGRVLRLTRAGKHLADRVAAELFAD